MTPLPPHKIYPCPHPQPVPTPFSGYCPHPHPLPRVLSPSPPHYRNVVWMCRELGLVASFTHTDVGSIVIQYNAPGPLSALSDSPTDHRLTMLHAATCELSVYLDGLRLRHECHPTYLGVTLDRTLSYREHLTKTAGKLKKLNNLLMKPVPPGCQHQ